MAHGSYLTYLNDQMAGEHSSYSIKTSSSLVRALVCNTICGNNQERPN